MATADVVLPLPLGLGRPTRLEVLCVLASAAVELALRLDLAFDEVDANIVVDRPARRR